MRFDLVDLQLFVAVAEARSITGGAMRAHLALASASARIKGLEAGARRRAAEARPPRRRADRGGRKPARSCPASSCTMSRRCAAISRPMPAACKASVRLLANTSGLSEYLPKALAAFLREHPDIFDRRRGARKRRHRRGDRGRRRRSRLRRRACACRTISSGSPSARTAWCWSPRAATNWPNRAAGRFREVVERDFVGLTNSTALQAHISGHAARLGARLRFRARLQRFRCDRPDGGGRRSASP